MQLRTVCDRSSSGVEGKRDIFFWTKSNIFVFTRTLSSHSRLQNKCLCEVHQMDRVWRPPSLFCLQILISSPHRANGFPLLLFPPLCSHSVSCLCTGFRFYPATYLHTQLKCTSFVWFEVQRCHPPKFLLSGARFISVSDWPSILLSPLLDGMTKVFLQGAY